MYHWSHEQTMIWSGQDAYVLGIGVTHPQMLTILSQIIPSCWTPVPSCVLGTSLYRTVPALVSGSSMASQYLPSASMDASPPTTPPEGSGSRTMNESVDSTAWRIHASWVGSSRPGVVLRRHLKCGTAGSEGKDGMVVLW